MTPPIQKDWWLAAALTSATLPHALGQTPTAADARPQSGVATTVTQGVGRSAPLYIDNAQNRKLSTGPNQTLHVLFSDRSALTLGPNTEVTISDYRYDAKANDGNIAVEAAKGLLRVVGGLLSKTRETKIVTPVATIGIRGGITIAETDGQRTSAHFLFGQGMRATDNNGNSQTITRAGFGTDIGNNNPPSDPRRIPSSEINTLLNRLETRPNPGNQNNPNPPPGPAGQLIPTGNNPDRLSNDRLKNLNERNENANPSNTLRTLLGTGNNQPQPPVQS